jgi:hypothetical protein
MGGAKSTRVAVFPHFGHFCRDGASKPSRFSYRLPHASQEYS